MIDSKHIINKDKTLLEGLKQINDIINEPLVLFVVDNDGKMIGTLTDGDSRRALIKGASVNSNIESVMHCDFSFIKEKSLSNVEELHQLRDLQIKLIPILDENHYIIDIVDLVNYITRLPFDAVLMAGGKGERLRPLTEHTPKPLLKVGDKCIIDHNIDRLISYGVQHINVTVNYLHEQIEEHFKEKRRNILIKTFREPYFMGTIGSLQFVDRFYHDTILVMNSDLFTNIDYEDFYLHFKHYNADMSVAAVPYKISIPLGILELQGRDILGILEKPQYNYYANAGIYLFKREVINEIPNDTFFNATDLIEKLILQGKKVIRYPLNGTWIDIGTPQEFNKAQDLVKHL